ncbi:Rha family transcriptional regulator [Roseateles toxinivorans]|uniref:Regulatory protein Rha n=1 Tax=Roseateles toxinivorans TaxID=270368 RepID=A0A4R6QKI4_9BURK|nr:Rha family transcriptional regulator [Roseateles toxinivorans]TDP63152.1 regulatory protein Rha [Roseateles toxinivorans]
MAELMTISGRVTITSREIATLVELRHDNVKRTIESLAAKGAITLPQSEEVSNDGPGPKTIAVYLVGKRDSYVIVAQLSPEFTARLVDRWQELEAQAAGPALPNFSDPVAAARAWADQVEANRAIELAARHPRPSVSSANRTTTIPAAWQISNHMRQSARMRLSCAPTRNKHKAAQNSAAACHQK